MEVGGADCFQEAVKVLQFGCLVVPLYNENLPNPDWVITGIKSRGHVSRCVNHDYCSLSAWGRCNDRLT